ncbi:MAG: CinA family protein [Oscillospiraceae bacterium]|nr:CinA family protein [Oscillospiraceae bacterium]
MMTTLCCKVLDALRERGMTLVTAESLTGGGIGAALTAVSGASEVYKGGVISYVNEVKRDVLGVPREILDHFGAVSEQTAGFMASGVRKLLNADLAVSVTGLAGPGGDEFGHPVGTVYIGFNSGNKSLVKHFCFEGTREEVRNQTIHAALELILEQIA